MTSEDPDTDTGADADTDDASIEADPYTLRHAHDIDGTDTAEGTDEDGTATDEGAAEERSGRSGATEAAHRVFWADAVADEIEARDSEEPIVIKGGVSPSGVPHLGHVNEILRSYFVAAVLRERGHEVRQVFTSDDRDPLRAVPHTLATLDFELVDLGAADDPGALGRNLGKPLTDVPDPFEGCECESFGVHQTELLRRSAERLDVPIEIVSNTDLYAEGAFEEVTRTLFDRRERAREVLSNYQSKVDAEYVPFNPVCGNCGKLTETVTEVHLDGDRDPESADGSGGESGAGSRGEASVDEADEASTAGTADGTTVEYVCTDMEAGNRVIEGCGHRGTATLREGKFPWRFEWPAQWATLGVDFEPFGKDHAEGSWPSGAAIAAEVLGIDAPVPMVYEWFTLGGQAISSSAGNVITVPEVLSMLELPVVRYFFAKDPTRARDFDVARLDQLVDEFDRFERAFFNEIEIEAQERRRAERVYPLLVEEVYEHTHRIPYTFAAVLGMTDDPTLRTELAGRQSHLPENASERAVSEALARVNHARTWAQRTDNGYNYRLATDLPETDFDAATEAALDDLASVVEAVDASAADTDADIDTDVDIDTDAGSEHGNEKKSEDAGEAIQSAIHESAREHDLDIGDFFAAGYRLFFDAEQGPRLGPFLAELDREFVVRRLRREA
jgi:lysyl-tRNA synthetase class 1